MLKEWRICHARKHHYLGLHKSTIGGLRKPKSVLAQNNTPTTSAAGAKVRDVAMLMPRPASDSQRHLNNKSSEPLGSRGFKFEPYQCSPILPQVGAAGKVVGA